MRVLFIRSGNRGLDPISQNQGQSLINKGIEVIFYNIIGKGLKGYLTNISRIRKIIEVERPDLVHAHYSLTGIATSLAFPGIPVVVSLMGSDIHTGQFWQRWVIRGFIHFFWDQVIVKSDQMKQKLNVNKAHVIPNGVDLNHFQPIDKQLAIKKLGWDNSKKHILFSSDPERPEKNYSLAKDAIDLILDEKPEVHFLMDLEHSEMPIFFNAADCLLLTSFYEGSPNVVKEALACNCPVVSTDVGDVKDLIKDVEGCYLTTFDKFDVSEKIQSVLRSNQRIKGKSSIQHLDDRLIADTLIDIYKFALEK